MKTAETNKELYSAPVGNAKEINELLRRYGVKFGIYKNGTFKEQLFPFDPIPRIINHNDFKGRNNLTAFISEDDGETWPYSLLLDRRNNVSYPDVKEDENGNIYVIYDRERGGFLDSF